MAAYDLSSRSPSGVVEDPSQALLESSVEETGGVTTLSFKRLLDNGGDIVLPAGAPVNVNWALGQADELGGGHQGDSRGSVQVRSHQQGG